MQFLAKLSVKRPVFATVLILLVCVIGLAGYAQLGVDRFPKVDFPTIAVITRMPGAAPEEVETEISQKIEEAVNSISGIDQLKSISSEGVSQVLVTFVLEKDADVAAQEVGHLLGIGQHVEERADVTRSHQEGRGDTRQLVPVIERRDDEAVAGPVVIDAAGVRLVAAAEAV